MEILPTKFKEAKIIVPMVHADYRGYFKETYHIKKHVETGIWMNWAQDGVSFSKKANTIRGLHFQPYMAKLVQCLHGSVFDVIVDISPWSETYLQWQGFVLSEENHHQLLVPTNFLHGFLTLTDDVIFSYKMSELYNATTEKAVHYDSLNIEWPISYEVIISEKDMNAPREIPEVPLSNVITR